MAMKKKAAKTEPTTDTARVRAHKSFVKLIKLRREALALTAQIAEDLGLREYAVANAAKNPNVGTKQKNK